MWRPNLNAEFICGRSLDVGDGRGDRGPDMLTGVGILEFEAIEEVRSCFTGMWGTCTAVVSGGICDVMLLYCKLA
jgi:hypothetical protein